MKEHEIIYKTRIHQGRGEYPSRVVLVKHFFNGKIYEYFVHMQAKSEKGWYLYGGLYFNPRDNKKDSLRIELRKAKIAFNKRVDTYPEFRGHHIKV